MKNLCTWQHRVLIPSKQWSRWWRAEWWERGEWRWWLCFPCCRPLHLKRYCTGRQFQAGNLKKKKTSHMVSEETFSPGTYRLLPLEEWFMFIKTGSSRWQMTPRDMRHTKFTNHLLIFAQTSLVKQTKDSRYHTHLKLMLLKEIVNLSINHLLELSMKP